MPTPDHSHHRAILDMLMRPYDERLIMNIERAAYVECLVTLALGHGWELTLGWAPWDVQHSSGARLEVKQGAAFQSWHPDSVAPARVPRFDIAPRTGYWSADHPESKVMESWIASPGRQADVYVFAWHGERNRNAADHRDASQWRFFVIAERKLPEQKSISLNPLADLAEPCGIDGIRQAVENVLPVRSQLKANHEG